MPPKNAKTNAMNSVINEVSFEPKKWPTENANENMPKQTIEGMIALTRMSLDLVMMTMLLSGRTNVRIVAGCMDGVKIVIGTHLIWTLVIERSTMIMFMTCTTQMMRFGSLGMRMSTLSTRMRRLVCFLKISHSIEHYPDVSIIVCKRLRDRNEFVICLFWYL